MATKTLKLITEALDPAEMIIQKRDPSKPLTMKFRGPFMMCESKNGNGRIYKYDDMKAEADRFTREMINENRALMELEHPSVSVIQPERASARTLSLTEDKNVWIGEGIILCSDEKFGIKGTPCGDILAALTNYGTKWGVSSRAVGEVDESTGIVKEFHLICLDTVLEPSIQNFVTSDGNRFVNGILESKQFVCDIHGEPIERKYNAFESRISKLPNTHISSKKAEALGAAVHSFLESLVN